MKRKLVGGLAVLLVAVAVIWWVKHRGEPAQKAAPGAPAQHAQKFSIPRTQPAASASQREWARDVDPEGPLRLEGQVVDADGAGVGGATVWLSSVPPRSATSEGDGTFAFDKVVGREYSLTADAGDRVGGPVSYRLTAKSDPVVIRVSGGAKVIVEVTGDDGQPVANANVKLQDFAETTKPTGPDGTVTLAPVHPGWVGVEVSAPGYGVTTGFGQVGSAGATATIRVKLHRGVAVSGRVIDEAGKPIGKAHVTAGETWWMASNAGEATTDDKGEFTFAALAAGTHVLHVEDGEHAPTRSMPVTVGDRPVSGITITMKEGGSIAGRVVDAQGNGVSYATIRVAAKSGEPQMMAAGRQAVSEKDGSFEVRGLARLKLQVRASSDDASSKVVDVDVATTAHTKDLKLVLDETGTIAGVVVDGDGKPVPEIQVAAIADYWAAERPTLVGLISATTDGAGAFTLRGLPDGQYRLRALRGGSSMSGWETQGIPAKVGDKNIKITLPAPATLVGKVQLENGLVPKLANVQLGTHPATPAAPDGTFKIEGLEPGKYDVRVLGPEFAQLTKSDVELKAGETTDLGTLALMRGRKLAGRVVDASGSPVSGARVTVSKTLLSMEGAQDQLDALAEMTGARSAVTDQEGAFTIIGIAKTHAFAGAEHPEKGRANPIDIPEGADDPPPVTLALRAFGAVIGKVTSEGQPAAGVTITDTLKGSIAQVGITRTGDDGSFSLSKVSEGTHVLNAMRMTGMGGASSTSVTVEVKGGQTANVTIDIPVGSIEVDVTIKPIANAHIDSAQVFLFRGLVTATTAKQLNDTFGAGGMQGVKFWFGEGKPMPVFDKTVPADYSVCGIPITGNMMDPVFAQRLQEHVDILKVYCKPVTVAPSPQKQAVLLELPAMQPLPDPNP
jgi:uncharacterized GH25 family protein